MEKQVQITLIIVAGVVLLGLIGLAIFSTYSPANTLTARGQSTIEVEPDLVGIYFRVQTQAATSEDAKDQNAEIVDDVITNLVKQGLERKDIKTQSFNIYPEYDWNSGSRNLKGYAATHLLKVELSTEDSDKIGEMLDAGVDAGASINYINFELSQELQNTYKAEATKFAAEDAKLKAEAMAEGLGKKLGRLVSTSDNSFDYYPWKLYEAGGDDFSVVEAKQATTDIHPGEQTIYAQVTAVFKIY